MTLKKGERLIVFWKSIFPSDPVDGLVLSDIMALIFITIRHDFVALLGFNFHVILPDVLRT